MEKASSSLSSSSSETDTNAGTKEGLKRGTNASSSSSSSSSETASDEEPDTETASEEDSDSEEDSSVCDDDSATPSFYSQSVVDNSSLEDIQNPEDILVPMFDPDTLSDDGEWQTCTKTKVKTKKDFKENEKRADMAAAEGSKTSDQQAVQDKRSSHVTRKESGMSNPQVKDSRVMKPVVMSSAQNTNQRQPVTSLPGTFSTNARPDLERTKLCRRYEASQSCLFGENCWFSHDLGIPIRSSTAPISSTTTATSTTAHSSTTTGTKPVGRRISALTRGAHAYDENNTQTHEENKKGSSSGNNTYGAHGMVIGRAKSCSTHFASPTNGVKKEWKPTYQPVIGRFIEGGKEENKNESKGNAKLTADACEHPVAPPPRPMQRQMVQTVWGTLTPVYHRVHSDYDVQKTKKEEGPPAPDPADNLRLTRAQSTPVEESNTSKYTSTPPHNPDMLSTIHPSSNDNGDSISQHHQLQSQAPQAQSGAKNDDEDSCNNNQRNGEKEARDGVGDEIDVQRAPRVQRGDSGHFLGEHTGDWDRARTDSGVSPFPSDILDDAFLRTRRSRSGHEDGEVYNELQHDVFDDRKKEGGLCLDTCMLLSLDGEKEEISTNVNSSAQEIEGSAQRLRATILDEDRRQSILSSVPRMPPPRECPPPPPGTHFQGPPSVQHFPFSSPPCASPTVPVPMPPSSSSSHTNKYSLPPCPLTIAPTYTPPPRPPPPRCMPPPHHPPSIPHDDDDYHHADPNTMTTMRITKSSSSPHKSPDYNSSPCTSTFSSPIGSLSQHIPPASPTCHDVGEHDEQLQ